MPNQIQITCPESDDPVNQDFYATGTVSVTAVAPPAPATAAVYIRCVVANASNGQQYKGNIQTTTNPWTYHFTVPIPTMSRAFLVAQWMDGPTEPAGMLASTSIPISVVSSGGVDCTS